MEDESDRRGEKSHSEWRTEKRIAKATKEERDCENLCKKNRGIKSDGHRGQKIGYKSKKREK